MNIYDLIFYEILKFDYSSPILNGELMHDLLYGLLLPSIALYMILDIFMNYVSGEHKRLRHIIAIGGLGVILVNGWYPIIASLYIPIFLIALILTGFNYFKRHIMSESLEKEIRKRVGGYLNMRLKQLAIKTDKRLLNDMIFRYVVLEKEIEKISKEINEILKAHGGADKLDGEVKEKYWNLVRSLETKKSERDMLLAEIYRMVGDVNKAEELIREVLSKINYDEKPDDEKREK